MQTVVDNPIPPMQGYSEYLIATYGIDNARTTTHNFLSAYTAIINNGGNISLDQADTITCPVLLISGDHDMFAPPALVSQIAAKIPDVEMVTVENGGHNLHEERPEWFEQTVLDWLKQH
jgi:pimeloyl-ACP methyl ester carboxylesterase